MDASKPNTPAATNALAGVAQAATPSAKPAAPVRKAPAANPQVRHPEDRVRGYQNGANPKPTKAFAGRSSTPASSNTSGMERAMGALADKMHAPKKRR